jgi:hypothetical protein
MVRSPSSGFARALRPALLAGLLTLALQGPPTGGSPLEARAVTDGQVKAAFLYNFANFVEWPDANRGPLVIGIAGDDAFAGIVAHTVRGRRAKGRLFETRRLASVDDPSGCQILFVSGLRPSEGAELLQRVRGPVLTVGETVQFLREGGMIRFYVENNRVKFQISQKNTTAAGLRVSSQLLALGAR